MTRILLAALAVASVALAQIPDYKDLKYPPLNPIKIPPVERYTLPNGMTIFLVEDHEIPVLRAQALVRSGDRLEPSAKTGLADITLRVMRTGGTTTRPGDALDQELDRLAASVETSSGEGSSSGSVFVLREDAERGLTILADLLQNPTFPQEKIDLAKLDVRDSISRRNDSADSIHYRELQRLLYGKASPYAAVTEYATLDAITRDDLVSYHKQYFQPENAYLAVWGDFKTADMKALVQRTFGTWAKGGKPMPPIPGVDRSAQAKGLHQIAKDDLNQSTIDTGLLLGKLDDPDYAPLRVMTQILGGGFSSRMFQRIRTKEGLAYAAYAGYSAKFDYPGFWFASVGTKSESTLKALGLMREEITRMRDTEVTAEELQLAKDSILKGEAFDYDSTGKIVGRLLTYEYNGYPADFLQRSRTAVEKVTIADVKRVANQYLKEDQFVTLVLGKPKDFDKPLSSLGSVKDIDISIPPPKGQEVAAATAETASAGKALLDKARAAHGGPALAKIKDYVAKMDMTMVTPQGEFPLKGEATVSTSGKSMMKMTTPMGEILQGFDGQKVWMKTPQGIQEMPPQVAGQARNSSLRETVQLLNNYDKPGYTTQALGVSKLEGKDVEGVLVKNDSLSFQVKVYFDPATGLLVGKNYMGQIPMSGPGEITETLSDIREVEGAKLPFRSVLTNNGKKAAEQKIGEFKVNTGVPDSAFTKPQQ
jgi:predicted Zn-dependent peptidase/outer membrane lipoprotein-sorting protein